MSNDLLDSFGSGLNVAVFGATGGIGSALVSHLLKQSNVERVFTFSRKSLTINHPKIEPFYLDLDNEKEVEDVAENIEKLDIIIIATGMLHSDTIHPEKSLKDININNFQQIFIVNTFMPSLIAKYFVPLLRRDKKVFFGALSARVGSIADNHLGGWYAYRASKAALNMILKNISIEVQRKNPLACIVGLHPGTVETDLSHPFHGGISPDKIFTPAYSAEKLLRVINQVTPKESGTTFAWDGDKIPF